ncbi:hypothetical protein ACFPOE_03170 [Caenimonas terrae]|uniref:Phage holin family protein n=1 Tax=Caenimonas terrae TaxID=696074 RepID=A0ABW0NBI1_9BURK
MTSFVHVAQPSEHPGIARADHAVESITKGVRHAMSARGTASLLLAAIVSALLVAANQVIDTWTEGHLLVAWIALWTIGFAGLALAAGPVRAAVNQTRASARGWATARRAAAQDEALWQVALSDARVMADISRAMSHEAASDVLGRPTVTPAPTATAAASRYEWGRGL